MAQAEYPEMARTAGVTGTVYVRVIVDSDGTPRSATVLKGIGAGCDEAATDAALRSTFKPGTSYGKPVECSITIPFTFP
ncbi:energy transducer TonB [bacterium]|nr:energy transducer TonB [bacterium]